MNAKLLRIIKSNKQASESSDYSFGRVPDVSLRQVISPFLTVPIKAATPVYQNEDVNYMMNRGALCCNKAS